MFYNSISFVVTKRDYWLLASFTVLGRHGNATFTFQRRRIRFQLHVFKSVSLPWIVSIGWTGPPGPLEVRACAHTILEFSRNCTLINDIFPLWLTIVNCIDILPFSLPIRIISPYYLFVSPSSGYGSVLFLLPFVFGVLSFYNALYLLLRALISGF